MIPAAVKAAEVSSKGTSIYAYEPNSPVSKAYAGFTKEVLADGRQKERLHAAHEHARWAVFLSGGKGRSEAV